MDLLKRDFALFDGLLSDDRVVVADTSFIETMVFSARAGIEMSPGVEDWIRDRAGFSNTGVNDEMQRVENEKRAGDSDFRTVKTKWTGPRFNRSKSKASFLPLSTVNECCG